jgi:hypothetical protein
VTAALLDDLAARGAFRPRQHLRQLVDDHVPFDRLVNLDRFEVTALRVLVDGNNTVAIVGPRGGGKSSLIAYVCANLPQHHLALRVPVAGADDPTSTSTIGAVALSQALRDIDLERHQREAIEHARADAVTAARGPGRLRGWRLGGGPIPAEVHGDLATLHAQVETRPTIADRLSGIERLIAILVARGLQPVFVFEDTEAAVGGADDFSRVDAFLSGPIRAFAREVEAPCIVAIQDVFTASRAFNELAPSMALVRLPVLDDAHAPGALRSIIDNRLASLELEVKSTSVIEDHTLGQLIAFYDEAGHDLRFTMAVLQSAVEYAAVAGASWIERGHVRAASTDWRNRIG